MSTVIPPRYTVGDQRRPVRQPLGLTLMARSLAGLGTAALLLSACSSGADSAAPGPGATSPAPADGGSPAPADGSGEGTAAGTTDVEAVASTEEEFMFRIELEVQRCMAARGWEYEPMDRDAIDQLLNGSIDNGDPLGFARRDGYGIVGFELSGDQLTSTADPYFDSLSPAEQDANLADFGTCHDEAAETVAGPGGLDAMGEQAILIQELIAADPGLIEARKQWSLCMADAGYSYATADEAVADLTARYDAVDKTDQAVVDEFKAEEIAVAVADVECQEEVGLTEAFEEARTRAEKEADG